MVYEYQLLNAMPYIYHVSLEFFAALHPTLMLLLSQSLTLQSWLLWLLRLLWSLCCGRGCCCLSGCGGCCSREGSFLSEGGAHGSI